MLRRSQRWPNRCTPARSRPTRRTNSRNPDSSSMPTTSAVTGHCNSSTRPMARISARTARCNSSVSRWLPWISRRGNSANMPLTAQSGCRARRKSWQTYCKRSSCSAESWGESSAGCAGRRSPRRQIAPAGPSTAAPSTAAPDTVAALHIAVVGQRAHWLAAARAALADAERSFEHHRAANTRILGGSNRRAPADCDIGGSGCGSPPPVCDCKLAAY